MNLRTCFICGNEFELENKKLWDEKNKIGFKPLCGNLDCAKKKREMAGFNRGTFW